MAFHTCCRPEGEPRLEGHRRMGRLAVEGATAACGFQPVALAGARALSGAHRCVAWAACSMAGHLLWWPSSAEFEALPTMGAVESGRLVDCGGNLLGWISPVSAVESKRTNCTGYPPLTYPWPWPDAKARRAKRSPPPFSPAASSLRLLLDDRLCLTCSRLSTRAGLRRIAKERVPRRPRAQICAP